MILADTSFIIAVIKHDDKNHQRCREVLNLIRTPLLTTLPCITEAMHLLGGQGQKTLILQTHLTQRIG